MKQFLKIFILVVAAASISALIGCSKENEEQGNSPATIQLQNNQMSVDGQVYNIQVSLAQTGENFGAQTTTIDFAVTTGEYDGSINLTASLENKQIDLANPLAVVGSNLLSINLMDRTIVAGPPHFFQLGVSEGQVSSCVGSNEPQSSSCFKSGWTQLSHDKQNMHFELSGVLIDGRKVEIKLNIPENEVFYF